MFETLLVTHYCSLKRELYKASQLGIQGTVETCFSINLKIENICHISFVVDHKLRKPSISNDNQDDKGKKVGHNSSDTDSFEDATDDTPSTHFDIFDVLSEASSQSNDTVDASNQTTAMYNEETETNPDEEATPDEETVEAENLSPHQDQSANSSTKTAKSK